MATDADRIIPVADGMHETAVRYENGEWVSVCPCHGRTVRVAEVEFHPHREVTLRCPVNSGLWTVRCDVWGGRGNDRALWIE